jgi:putative spermidine/putrescine transport system substrate-binding protein
MLQALVAGPFEKAGLGRVEYEVATTASALAKIQSQKANPPFDIVMMSRSTTYRAGRAGLAMTIAPGDIPALSETIPNTLNPGGFGVGFVLDTFAIMVDKRQVAAPMTSWLDLWRPELRGKIVLPAASLGLSTYLLLCLARTLGQGKIDDRSVDLAFGKLVDLKPHVRTFYTDPNQASQLVARGDIAAAPQLSIRIANNMKSNPTVGRFMPEEGTPSLPFDLSIPINASNAVGARKYINFILGKDIQTELATGLLATPVQKSVEVPENLRPFMMLDMSKIWSIDEDYVASKARDWSTRWTREVQV